MGLSGVNLTHIAVQRSGCWGKQKSGFSLEAVARVTHHGERPPVAASRNLEQLRSFAGNFH